MELHIVHKNIYDNPSDNATKHENSFAVLGFIFEVVERKDTTVYICINFILKCKNQDVINEGMEKLTRIVDHYLTKPDSKFAGWDRNRTVCRFSF